MWALSWMSKCISMEVTLRLVDWDVGILQSICFPRKYLDVCFHPLAMLGVPEKRN
jgi:hypothetical protein